MNWNPFHRKPHHNPAPVLTIGMTVEFDGKLWVISGDSDYYTDAVNLLLEPVQ